MRHKPKTMASGVNHTGKNTPKAKREGKRLIVPDLNS
jgi:hypothetical protein